MTSLKKIYHRVFAISSLASMITLKAKYHRLVARSSILASMIPLTQKYHKVVARSRRLARSSLANARTRPRADPLEPDAPITASLGSPATNYTVTDNNNWLWSWHFN